MTKMTVFYEGDLKTRSVQDDFVIFTDAPKDNQGEGKGFSPTDLLAVALGSCFLTLMGIMAKKIQVDVKGASVTVHKEMSLDPPRRIKKIKIDFSCPYVFSPEVTQKLEKAARECPIHYSLHPDMEKEYVFNWGR